MSSQQFASSSPFIRIPCSPYMIRLRKLHVMRKVSTQKWHSKTTKAFTQPLGARRDDARSWPTSSRGLENRQQFVLGLSGRVLDTFPSPLIHLRKCKPLLENQRRLISWQFRCALANRRPDPLARYGSSAKCYLLWVAASLFAKKGLVKTARPAATSFTWPLYERSLSLVCS